MISIETRIEGFDERSWHRLVTIVAPWIASRAPHEASQHAAQPGGGLIMLFEGERVLSAFHTHRGVVAIDVWPGAEALGAVAVSHGARVAVAAQAGALEDLYERLGGRLRIDDSPAIVVVTVLGALRELEEEGALVVWPRVIPSQVPLPTAGVVEKLMDHVLPENRSALVVLLDGDGLDTAILVHRRGAFVDCVYGPESIRAMVGPLGGDYRRDYRVIRQGVEGRVGQLAVGLYAERDALVGLLADPRPGAWAEAIASRTVIVDPMPAWLAVAAGSGVVRAAALRSKGVLAGLGVLGALSPAVRRLRELAESVVSLDVEGLLGFNPMRLLATLRKLSGNAERSSEERDR